MRKVVLNGEQHITLATEVERAEEGQLWAPNNTTSARTVVVPVSQIGLLSHSKRCTQPTSIVG